MNTLTAMQKNELFGHMESFQDDSFIAHATWASRRFGVTVLEAECSKFYMATLLGEPVA